MESFFRFLLTIGIANALDCFDGLVYTPARCCPAEWNSWQGDAGCFDGVHFTLDKCCINESSAKSVPITAENHSTSAIGNSDDEAVASTADLHFNPQACWSGPYTKERCCARAGDPACFNNEYTYQKCCGQREMHIHPEQCWQPSAGYTAAECCFPTSQGGKLSCFQYPFTFEYCCHDLILDQQQRREKYYARQRAIQQALALKEQIRPEQCWSGEFTAGLCCHPIRSGGNPLCFEYGPYTFDLCCEEYARNVMQEQAQICYRDPSESYKSSFFSASILKSVLGVVGPLPRPGLMLSELFCCYPLPHGNSATCWAEGMTYPLCCGHVENKYAQYHSFYNDDHAAANVNDTTCETSYRQAWHIGAGINPVINMMGHNFEFSYGNPEACLALGDAYEYRWVSLNVLNYNHIVSASHGNGEQAFGTAVCVPKACSENQMSHIVEEYAVRTWMLYPGGTADQVAAIYSTPFIPFTIALWRTFEQEPMRSMLFLVLLPVFLGTFLHALGYHNGASVQHQFSTMFLASSGKIIMRQSGPDIIKTVCMIYIFVQHSYSGYIGGSGHAITNEYHKLIGWLVLELTDAGEVANNCLFFLSAYFLVRNTRKKSLGGGVDALLRKLFRQAPLAALVTLFRQCAMKRSNSWFEQMTHPHRVNGILFSNAAGAPCIDRQIGLPWSAFPIFDGINYCGSLWAFDAEMQGFVVLLLICLFDQLVHKAAGAILAIFSLLYFSWNAVASDSMHTHFMQVYLWCYILTTGTVMREIPTTNRPFILFMTMSLSCSVFRVLEGRGTAYRYYSSVDYFDLSHLSIEPYLNANWITRTMWSLFVDACRIPGYLALCTWINRKPMSDDGSVLYRVRRALICICEMMSLVCFSSLVIHPITGYLAALRYSTDPIEWTYHHFFTDPIWLGLISCGPGLLCWFLIQQPWCFLLTKCQRSMISAVCNVVWRKEIVTKKNQ